MKKLGWGGASKNRQRENSPLQKLGLVMLMTVWVFCVIVAVQLIVGYLMLWILGRDGFLEPVWQLVYTAITYILALVLIILVPSRLEKKWRTNREELGLMGLPTWQDILLAIISFIVATLAGALLAGLFSSLFPWFDASQAQETGFTVYMFGIDRVIAFLALVVFAPIAEEIIFRGWLYGKLRQVLTGKLPEWAGMAIAILVTSVLFGLIHFQWNVGVNVFALSVVLCGLREVTGTIYAGILTHMIKNGVAFYLVYVLGVG